MRQRKVLAKCARPDHYLAERVGGRNLGAFIYHLKLIVNIITTLTIPNKIHAFSCSCLQLESADLTGVNRMLPTLLPFKLGVRIFLHVSLDAPNNALRVGSEPMATI